MAKSAWLQEVEDDANRLTLKRIKDQKEEAEYQASKANLKVSADESPAPQLEKVLEKKGTKK